MDRGISPPNTDLNRELLHEFTGGWVGVSPSYLGNNKYDRIGMCVRNFSVDNERISF